MKDRFLGSFAAVVIFNALGTSQCNLEWFPANTYPGTNGLVNAVTRWDPDGPGPLTERIAVGGYFSAAGGVAARNVASYDPATGTWSALGNGLDGQGSVVQALIGLPDGRLLAGGFNIFSPGGANGHTMVWNGTQWQSLGSFQPIVHGVVSFALDTGGMLFAGGSVSGGGIAGVGRWTGAAWQSIGSTSWNGYVRALAFLPNGDLVAGGAFSSIGNLATSNIARWDGTSWHALGSGLTSPVASVVVLPTGELVATTSGGLPGSSGVMRWNGSAWSALGGSFGSGVLTSAVMSNGDLVVGGLFTLPTQRIARWDGSAWWPMGSGADSTVTSLVALPGGDLIVGGNFRNIDGTGRSFVARWNNGWSSLGQGFDESLLVIEPLPNGDVLVGGRFTHAGAFDAGHVARWRGGAWHALGTGVASTITAEVRAIEALPNGDVVVGGLFETAGGVSAPHLARFDGSSWHAMGTSPGPGTVYCLLELPNGELLVGGGYQLNGVTTYLAKWSPAGWSTLPAPPNAGVTGAMLLASGEILISGAFTMVGSTPANGIARGDGTTWTALGSGIGGTWIVPNLAEMRDGTIVVGGVFSTAGGAPIPNIAQWNGAQWLPLGPNYPFAHVRSIVQLPDGDLVVGGLLNQPPPAHIARWNGSTWSTLAAVQGSATGGSVGGSPSVGAMGLMPTGHLAVSGFFLGGGPHVSPYLALLAPSCPARVAGYGAGCVGSGGLNQLVATTLPWLRSPFRARATGLAPSALVVAAWAFQSLQLPMPSVHPQGQPGCTLLVSDHILIDVANSNGEAATTIDIPQDPALVGTDFYHQVVAVEVGSGNAITALTSTNALAATVGVW